MYVSRQPDIRMADFLNLNKLPPTANAYRSEERIMFVTILKALMVQKKFKKTGSTLYSRI